MLDLFEYKVDGVAYKVNITRKRMKNIRYLFRDGEFYVSCPRLTAKFAIVAGLDRFAKKMIEKAAKKPIVNENEIYILGEKYELSMNSEIVLPDGNVIKYSDKDNLEKKLKKIFKDLITERVRAYEKYMGAPEYKVRVQNMKTRFGSNSKHTKTLNFATTLMQYSLPIIDSVVVHEIAHDFVFDHSEKFYNVVYKFCPNYKYYRSCLIKRKYHD